MLLTKCRQRILEEHLSSQYISLSLRPSCCHLKKKNDFNSTCFYLHHNASKVKEQLSKYSHWFPSVLSVYFLILNSMLKNDKNNLSAKVCSLLCVFFIFFSSKLFGLMVFHTLTSNWNLSVSWLYILRLPFPFPWPASYTFNPICLCSQLDAFWQKDPSSLFFSLHPIFLIFIQQLDPLSDLKHNPSCFQQWAF